MIPSTAIEMGTWLWLYISLAMQTVTIVKYDDLVRRTRKRRIERDRKKRFRA